MKRGKPVLLIASMLLVGVSAAANASLWKHSKSDPTPQASTPAAMSLTAVDIESAPAPRLLLRTTATPAYTSYSPTPDTFVVDLSGASKADALSMPKPLPPSITAITADDVTEMGAHVTRVTVHLAQPQTLQAAADGNAVVIPLPAAQAAAVEPVDAPVPQVQTASAPPASIQPIAEPVETTAQTSSAPAPVVDQPVETKAEVKPVETKAEVKSEPKNEPVVEPAVSAEPLPAQKAKNLKSITTRGSGSSLEIALNGDGEIAYNAFKLEKPSRIVLDLNGVKDAVTKPAIHIADAHVKRIRVSQFKGAPDPVTRVVLDLDQTVAYKVTKTADHLLVSFGGTPVETPAVAAVTVTESKPPATVAPAPATTVAKNEPKVQPKSEPKKNEPAPAAVDVTERVPVIADTTPTPEWKMPDHRPTAVINAPAPQQPPTTTSSRRKSTAATTTTPATTEDVFTNDQTAPAPANTGQPAITNAGQSIGTRTLSGSDRVFTGEPITLRLKDADIKDVLRTFHELTGLNIAVDPGVNGSVTVDFVDVPWDQALDIILRQNNLGYVLEGNVMRIGSLSRLAEEATASRRLAEEQRLAVPLQTVSYKLSYARATEVSALLKEVASPRARIIVDQRTNQVIISDIPAYIDLMRQLIDSVDVPTRQVVIEARIVETSKNFAQQYGFNWGFHGVADPSLGTGTGLVFPNRVDLTGGPFNFGDGNPILSFTLSNVLNTFNLDFTLLAAESEGLVRVISAPRVQTQDNVPAEIQSGFQIPFQTRVNFTTNIQYVDATLRLSVTPQITEAGTVIMDIAVQKNEPDTGLALEGAAGTPISTRQARTRLMVRDGGTTVIAGIYQTKENNAQSRLPFVWQIPIIGNLFKQHDITTTHDELLIFITPRIVRAS